jgi:hypothetical protein
MAMASSRWTIALLGLIGSLALSAVLWIVFDTAVFFLIVPFVPFVLGGGGRTEPEPVYRCPICDFQTTGSGYEYCPRDGTRLREE